MDAGNLVLALALRAKWLHRRLRVGSHLHRNDALGALHRAWAYVHATQLAGDYYEFGVYRGNSLACSWLSYRHFRRRMTSRAAPFGPSKAVRAFAADRACFFGFDTFAGMPANAEGGDYVATGSFRASRAEAEQCCAAVGLRTPDLVLVPGLFSDSLARVGTRPAAVVHLDCDLHASARDALEVVGPLVRQGSVLLCDDYDLFEACDDKGERRALRDFSERHGVRFEPWFAYGAASRAFLCHRTALRGARVPEVEEQV